MNSTKEEVEQCYCRHKARFHPLKEADTRECARLTAEQQQGTQDLLMTVRRENEDYLREHPEICALIEMFVDKMLCEKPIHGHLSRAVAFFTRPQEELQRDIELHLSNSSRVRSSTNIYNTISEFFNVPEGDKSTQGALEESHSTLPDLGGKHFSEEQSFTQTEMS